MTTTASRFTVALIVEILYGHKVDSMDDPLVQLAERAGRGTSEAAAVGSNSLTALTDFFPISVFAVLTNSILSRAF